MPPRTKSRPKKPSDGKTLKRKRENDDYDRLKKAIDEFVCMGLVTTTATGVMR